MYKILKAETLAAKIHLMVVHAPRVASHCQPGQFIIVKMDEKGERIPLTICDYDREEGTITIVFQEIGASTIKMSELKAGTPPPKTGLGLCKTIYAPVSAGRALYPRHLCGVVVSAPESAEADRPGAHRR